jgi:hypothetical protein
VGVSWKPPLKELRPLRGLVIPTCVVFVAAFGAYWGLSQLPSDAFFSMDAVTEVVSIQAPAYTERALYIPEATLALDDGAEEVFSGRIEPGPESWIRMERVGTGDLWLSIRGSGDRAHPDPTAAGRCGASAAEASIRGGSCDAASLLDLDESRRRVARSRLDLQVPSGALHGLVLPFSGRAVLGELVATQSEAPAPILEGGTVRMVVGSSGGQYQFAGEIPLDAGTRVSVDTPRRGHSSGEDGASGFVRPGIDGALEVTYEARGASARVQRYATEEGEGDQLLRPSTWTRWGAHPDLVVMGSIMLVLFTLVAPSIFNLAAQALLDREQGQQAVGAEPEPSPDARGAGNSPEGESVRPPGEAVPGGAIGTPDGPESGP